MSGNGQEGGDRPQRHRAGPTSGSARGARDSSDIARGRDARPSGSTPPASPSRGGAASAAAAATSAGGAAEPRREQQRQRPKPKAARKVKDIGRKDIAEERVEVVAVAEPIAGVSVSSSETTVAAGAPLPGPARGKAANQKRRAAHKVEDIDRKDLAEDRVESVPVAEPTAGVSIPSVLVAEMPNENMPSDHRGGVTMESSETTHWSVAKQGQRSHRKAGRLAQNVLPNSESEPIVEEPEPVRSGVGTFREVATPGAYHMPGIDAMRNTVDEDEGKQSEANSSQELDIMRVSARLAVDETAENGIGEVYHAISVTWKDRVCNRYSRLALAGVLLVAVGLGIGLGLGLRSPALPAEQTDYTWCPTDKILPSDGAANDRLGTSADISGDTVVIGADFNDDNGDSSGSAYVFTRTSTDMSWNINSLSA